MNTNLIKQLETLLKTLPKNAYGDKNLGIHSQWITQSEQKYNLTLPEHYTWFIKNYDFISLWGELTKTVFPPEYQNDTDQDIFNYHISNQDADTNYNKLIFLTTEDFETFYFKINQDKAEEQVYYESIYNQDELYSENFIEFLLKEIPKNY